MHCIPGSQSVSILTRASRFHRRGLRALAIGAHSVQRALGPLPKKYGVELAGGRGIWNPERTNATARDDIGVRHVWNLTALETTPT